MLPGYIEIRDKGTIKKKILTKNKSFDDVLAEVKAFFKIQGKILPPTLLHDVLIKIGLPKVKLIIQDKDIELEQISSVRPELMEGPTKPASTSGSTRPPMKTETSKLETNPEESTDRELEVPVKIGDAEVVDIVEALSVVESLSDSFMTPQQSDKDESPKKEAPPIKISLQGVEEIQATESSQATVIPSESSSSTAETESIIEQETEPEQNEETEEIIHEVQSEQTDTMSEIHVPVAEPSIMTGTMPIKETSAAMVKPLIEKKAIILGEEEVGKLNLITKAGFLPILTEDLSTPYIYEKTFETDTHRVKLRVWSFDQASLQSISRRVFYANVDVAIIVYSAVDRWSFQSIDFWLKEAGASSDHLPPLVIVANKIDLRDIAGPQAVTHEEGFALAENLAKSSGVEDSLHPTGFIETSCTTGEGVDALFQLAAELAMKTTCDE